MRKYDVIIIGAGPAGLFCARNISSSILIIDKMKMPGQKLLLSGTGQCNFTHTGEINEFLTHYGDHGAFLKPAIREFSNKDCIQLFKDNGIPVDITEEGKVFPKSRKAKDVLDFLLNSKNDEILIDESITSIQKNNSGFTVKTETSIYSSKYLVIATGGKSYPHTGSDGSGYHLAELLGHTIIPPKEALTPVYIKNFPLKELSGISIENATVQIWHDNKKIKENKGDLLITHFGFSGPVILDASRWMKKGDILKISFIPFKMEDFEQLILEKSITEGGKLISNVITEIDIPDRLVKKLTPNSVKCSQLTVEQRRSIVKSFCEYEVQINKLGSFQVAMATAGGVSLDEVNRKTCESKICPGLFFCGEVLDIDGDTGGYNIQAAFSTAYLISHAIEKLRDTPSGGKQT